MIWNLTSTLYAHKKWNSVTDNFNDNSLLTVILSLIMMHLQLFSYGVKMWNVRLLVKFVKQSCNLRTLYSVNQKTAPFFSYNNFAKFWIYTQTEYTQTNFSSSACLIFFVQLKRGNQPKTYFLFTKWYCNQRNCTVLNFTTTTFTVKHSCSHIQRLTLHTHAHASTCCIGVCAWKRMRRLSSSAIIQPTDQTSTAEL